MVVLGHILNFCARCLGLGNLSERHESVEFVRFAITQAGIICSLRSGVRIGITVVDRRIRLLGKRCKRVRQRTFGCITLLVATVARALRRQGRFRRFTIAGGICQDDGIGCVCHVPILLRGFIYRRGVVALFDGLHNLLGCVFRDQFLFGCILKRGKRVRCGVIVGCFDFIGAVICDVGLVRDVVGDVGTRGRLVPFFVRSVGLF